MTNENYKIGERRRFSINKAGKPWYVEGPILEICPEFVRVQDERSGSIFDVYFRSIMFTEQRPAPKVGGAQA